jgi:hypothetical protein
VILFLSVGLICSTIEKVWAVSVAEQEEMQAIPSDEEQAQPVSTTMHVFAFSINDKSMKRFYNHISALRQGQVTVEQLNGMFKVFMDRNMNLTVLDNLEPSIHDASINLKGVLTIKGEYPETDGATVVFKMEYFMEGKS